MNRKMREAFAVGNAKNDQLRETIFAAIKHGYQKTPGLTEAVRIAICEEANQPPFQTEGVEAGEIPEGDAE